MTLSSTQKALIQELKANPDWQGILKVLQAPPARRYKPSKMNSPDIDQEKDWIYDSGRSFENELILQILKGERNGRK